MIMNNELTNVYGIMKKEFKKELEHFGIENNRELASFLHYNAHNQMFIGTDDNHHHNVNFKNLETGRVYNMFKEESIHFFPKGPGVNLSTRDMSIFSINQGTKCIKVNSNGLFIEKSDLDTNIVTYYYDMIALIEILKKRFDADFFDHLEDYIQAMGINPDRIFMAQKKDNHFTISVIENDEIIEQNQVPLSEKNVIFNLL